MSQTLASETVRTVPLATFYVRHALCALDAAGIQEVIRLGPVTPVRHAPGEIVGIVNLRGKIVTILDLGLRLGFPPASPGREARVFIMEDRNEFVGLLVDRVDEVVEADPEQWAPLPSNLSFLQARFFQGVCRIGDRVIALLKPAEVLAECAQ